MLAFMTDLVFGVALVAIVGFIGTMLALGWYLTAHYREAGALAHDTFTPGRPCRLELPASGPLDLMLRFATTRSRGQSESLSAMIEVVRPEGTERYAVALSPTAPEPPGFPFRTSDGMSFSVMQSGRTSTRTRVLGRVPAGGPGHVLVDVFAPNADVGYCAAFVKPSRT